MKCHYYKIVVIAALGLSSTLFIRSESSGGTGTSASSDSMAAHRAVNAGPVKTAQKPAAADEVGIGDFEFIPATLTVPVGTTVTWTNRDGEAHTVNSTTGAFKSSPMDTDEKFSFKFTVPGTYPYYCRLHPEMKGQIVVR